VRSWTSSHVIGSPETVRAGLLDLVARTGADELIITTNFNFSLNEILDM
jgi:alkanesulfonate monooxygenase SsuD/methylene tetrahydromethanopterin reductase-like flavin-dependent oxidoreductase (luciferase family)